MTRDKILKIAKPTLFNIETTKKILNGEKTQIRLLIKRTKYEIGDILYVRETYGQKFCNECDNVDCKQYTCQKAGFCYKYKLDGEDRNRITGKWHPSLCMPRDALRIFLRITNIRAERLQEIKYFDCLSEGVPYRQFEKDIIHDFSEMWNKSIKESNLKKYGWDANPWVWVIDFERIEVA